MSNILGYDAASLVSPEPAPADTQRSKFVYHSNIPDKDMVNGRLVLCQENYGDPTNSSKTCNDNMKLVTQPLLVLLGVTDGFKIILSSCGGGHKQDQQDSVHIQTRLMTTKQKVDELQERAKEMDLMGVCTYSGLKGAENDQ